MQLSICPKRRLCVAGSFDEVGEAGEAPPYDGHTRRRVGSAVEIASEARNHPDIEIQIVRYLALSVRCRVFEQVALRVREDCSRFRSRCITAEHRQLCHPPGDDAAKRNAVDQAIGRSETQILDPAAGLKGPEESLDLSAQGVPFEPVHGVRVGRHRQVRDQLPDERSSALRRVEFLGMEDLEGLMPVFPVLSNRRPDSHRGVPD